MAESATTRPRVRFGTSGWRGVLGQDFGFEGARALARAVADHAREHGRGRPVLVAHDTRFLGEVLAREAARVVAGARVAVLRVEGPVPTPIASHAVRVRDAAAGILFTASHNPPEYQGMKVLAPGGGAAEARTTRDLERRTAAILRRGPPRRLEPGGRAIDPRGAYFAALGREVPAGPVRRAGLRAVVDAMHGVGAGAADRALAALGVQVTLLRGEPDPRFGGSPPDPAAERLGELSLRVRRLTGQRFGLATDGDADRFAAVDGSGRVLSETDSLALLVDHLARTGRADRGVAISVATGTLVERVARDAGLAVTRHPIGFKHLTRELHAGRADVAGEESGGFAWAPVSRDKDGILAGVLLAELVALEGGLGTRLAALRRLHGLRVCGRRALALSVGCEGDAILARVAASLPARVDGARIVEATEPDGLHLALPDGFMMLRASGTEPVLRVYAEAPSPDRLVRRLEAGLRLARRQA